MTVRPRASEGAVSLPHSDAQRAHPTSPGQRTPTIAQTLPWLAGTSAVWPFTFWEGVSHRYGLSQIPEGQFLHVEFIPDLIPRPILDSVINFVSSSSNADVSQIPRHCVTGIRKKIILECSQAMGHNKMY